MPAHPHECLTRCACLSHLGLNRASSDHRDLKPRLARTQHSAPWHPSQGIRRRSRSARAALGSLRA
eukprot:7238045-Alexandrium_andersonii.AAC.1